MSRSSIGNNQILVITIIINNTSNRLPTVLNIVEIPPKVTGVDNGRIIGLEVKNSVESCLQN